MLNKKRRIGDSASSKRLLAKKLKLTSVCSIHSNRNRCSSSSSSYSEVDIEFKEDTEGNADDRKESPPWMSEADIELKEDTEENEGGSEMEHPVWLAVDPKEAPPWLSELKLNSRCPVDEKRRFNPSNEELWNSLKLKNAQPLANIESIQNIDSDFYGYTPSELYDLEESNEHCPYVLLFIHRQENVNVDVNEEVAEEEVDREKRVAKGGYWLQIGTIRWVYHDSTKKKAAIIRTFKYFDEGIKTDWLFQEMVSRNVQDQFVLIRLVKRRALGM